MNTPVTAILLAAGRSHRFGADKLLQRGQGGVPLAVAAARSLCAARVPVVAVVRGHDELARLLADEGARVVVNETADQGMGSSIRTGVIGCPDAAGWLIALADMPAIQVSTIAAVAHALEQHAAIAAPAYGGQRGHPVGFSRLFRDALTGLDDDHGARHLLTRHGDDMQLIDVDDPGILVDVDRPADLERLGAGP